MSKAIVGFDKERVLLLMITPGGNNLYHFGPFCLDAAGRVLLREGRLVPLPPKAVLALLVLVQQSGHVIEKDDLLKEVWPDQDVEEGNLAQNIFLLRKAFGEVHDLPQYIETIPRRGYRFAANLRVENSDTVVDSLAILPFANVNTDPELEYLSDGITDNIINALSNLPRLKVMARNTVFRYKGVDIGAQEVGRCLGVRAVVMGRVQQLGEHLMISLELINAQDGSLIWSNQYRRKSADIFSMQDELASEISEKLRLRLNGEQKQALPKPHTQSTDAYSRPTTLR